MGIFDKFFGRNNDSVDNTSGYTPPAPAANPVSAPSEGILNLQKGDILDLTKAADSGLSKVRAAAGWSINKGVGQDYDLDLCAYLMEGKTVKRVVYYGKKDGPGISLDGDNLTGSTGQNDDENITVFLDQIPSNIDKIIFAVVIYQADSRHQSFGKVKNAYMRLVDERNGKEICRYVLSSDGGSNTAAKLASLNRTGSGWSFEAIGQYSRDSIETLSRKL